MYSTKKTQVATKIVLRALCSFSLPGRPQVGLCTVSGWQSVSETWAPTDVSGESITVGAFLTFLPCSSVITSFLDNGKGDLAPTIICLFESSLCGSGFRFGDLYTHKKQLCQLEYSVYVQLFLVLPYSFHSKCCFSKLLVSCFLCDALQWHLSCT